MPSDADKSNPDEVSEEVLSERLKIAQWLRSDRPGTKPRIVGDTGVCEHHHFWYEHCERCGFLNIADDIEQGIHAR